MLRVEKKGGKAEAESIDAFATHKNRAIEALRTNRDFIEQIRTRGKLWGVILGFLADELPKTIEEQERRAIANQLVPDALEQVLGPRNEVWHTSQEPNRNGKQITWVKSGKEEPATLTNSH